MEDINIYMCLFLIVTGFIAAFIDTVVGGGGLISLPALLFTGMPPVTAIIKCLLLWVLQLVLPLLFALVE